jgi:hypothetical protein
VAAGRRPAYYLEIALEAQIGAGATGTHRHSISLLEDTCMAQHGIAREIWEYMKVRKKWWLLPVIIVLMIVGALLIFAQGSALAPFIYTIF